MEALIEAFFLNNYRPAEDWSDATEFFTTKQIVSAINEHTGGMMEPSAVYSWMSTEGYHFDSLDGINFVWLVRNI